MIKFLLIILFLTINIANSHSQKRYLKYELDFIVNTDSIIKNDKYNLFYNEALPFLMNNIGSLELMNITGYASPEGDLKNNVDLANRRAFKAYETIGVDLGGRIRLNANPDTYDMLYGLIYKTNEPYRKSVLLKISNKEDISKDIDVWNDMKKKYFQKLRKSTILMAFDFSESDNEKKVDIVYVNKTQKDTIYIRDCHKRIPILSLKTNIPLDLLPYSPFGLSITPNISVELYTYIWNTSVEFEYLFPWWKNDNNHKYYQIINGTIGIRKYFNNDYKGFFLGIHGNSGYFDLSRNENVGWQGEFIGAGLSFGYVWRYGLVRFEPYIRVGFLNFRYDEYHAGNPFAGKYYYSSYIEGKRRYNSTYIGPTMIGFNISLDVINIWKKYSK